MRTALAGLLVLVSAAPGGAAETWHYGASLDTAYLGDLNHPDNHAFRGRGTTPKVEEPSLGLALAYARKDPVEASRWGGELAVQTGKDTRDFGYSASAPNIQGGDALRHFGRANLSYLAPVGRGLTLQGGLFSSLIGEESLWSKDNFNETRSWIADFSPYLMFGADAAYPFSDATTGSLFVIHHYFHLSQPDSEPAYGAQLAHKALPELTLKQTFFYGPDQAQASVRFWRFFSESIAEWRKGPLAAWLDWQTGTERLAQHAGPARVFWTGAALGARWSATDRASVSLRPEFYWDHDGRLTGARQLVKALTTTLEYKLPWRRTTTLARLEHRWDQSTGPDGGFFYGKDSSGPSPTLRPNQHLLIAALVFDFDSP